MGSFAAQAKCALHNGLNHCCSMTSKVLHALCTA
ncbi:Uncharacterised protein [Vibrio cholerae]|nr:Uncharacterised protein [Vibrio cholerae]